MAFTPGQSNGQSNGTSDVTLCPAPTSGTRVVRTIFFYNADTASATVTVQFDKNGTERKLFKQTLTSGEAFEWSGVISLADNDESLEFFLASAVATTELDFYVAFGDLT